mgnify:CR=1 FL=1
MRVRYEFVNGEWSEIEVEDSLGELLVELDRQEYNNDHRETRRHMSLDGMDYEGALFAAPDNPAAELVWKEDATRLRQAMEALSPAQRELVCRVYFENEKITDIARQEGVDKSAISHRLDRIYRKLKKFLK